MTPREAWMDWGCEEQLSSASDTVVLRSLEYAATGVLARNRGSCGEYFIDMLLKEAAKRKGRVGARLVSLRLQGKL